MTLAETHAANMKANAEANKPKADAKKKPAAEQTATK